MYKYAQINSENICFAVSYLSGEVIADDMIMLNEEDEPLGKKYNNGAWEELPPQPAPEPEPSQLDRIEEAVTAKNQDIAQAAIDNYTLELIEGGIL